MSKYIWMLSIIAIFFSSPGFCAFKVKGYGFVSLPDNVDSLWVNPASLAQIPERELMTSYHRLYYNLNYGRVGRSLVGYGQPVGNNIGMGIDWTNLSLNGYEELCYTLACGYRVSDSFMIGINLKSLEKRVSRNEWIDKDPVFDYGQKTSVIKSSVDIGGLWRLGDKISVGMLLEDINQPDMGFKDKDMIPMSIRLGAAYYHPWLTSLIEAAYRNKEIRGKKDVLWHIGLEKYLNDNLTIWAGWDHSGGILGSKYGFKRDQIPLSIAYNLKYPVNSIKDTSCHELSLKIGLGGIREEYSPEIRIKKLEINSISAAHYRYYSQHPMGTLTIKNISQKELKDIKINFSLSNYTTLMWESAGNLLPGCEKEILFKASISNQILHITENMDKEAMVQITYRVKDMVRTKSIKQRCPVFHKNAIVWNDMKKIGSFINPDDKSVREMVRHSELSICEDYDFLSRNLRMAMLIFYSIKASAIKYDPDRAHREKMTIDHVQFPAETLRIKAGDCDDLVVLYASCLEHAGIPVSIIDCGDHVLLMFELGTENRGVDQEKTIWWEDKRWIPIESSVYENTFEQSWVQGINKYKQCKELINLKDAWKEYPPAIYPESGSIALPDKDRIKEMFAWEMERQIDSSLMQDVEPLEKISAYNELGRLYIENGLYQRALNSFERGMALCLEDESIYLWIGDIHYRLNQYERAVNAYEKYIDAHPDDALAHRHLGAAYYALSEYKRAEAAFGKATKLAFSDKGTDPELIMSKDDAMIKDKGRQKVKIDFVWEEDRNPNQ